MLLLKNRYFWLLLAFFIFSFNGVLAKMAASSAYVTGILVFAGLQVLLLGVYAIIWQQVLKKFKLVTALSYRGIVVILSLIWAVIFFGEAISAPNIIGSMIIVVGIYIVSTGDRDGDEA
ncbi:MAG: transporter [Defluviitaleaceae bacterium]|nr:transporter [Defluviitaleaceae bacterium]